LAAQPALTEADPQDGAVLDNPPESMHLCFSEAVKVDQAASGQAPNWRFNMKTPDGTALGLRIVFRPEGDCVDVYPGFPATPPNGIWNFDWLVHAQSDGAEGSGVIRFQLGALRASETPLPAPAKTKAANQGSDDGGTPAILYVIAGLGVAIVVAGAAGFVLSRVRR